jgi:hypothetical protein
LNLTELRPQLKLGSGKTPMCYSLYISTDSSEDLSSRNSELVRFERVSDSNAGPCVTLLDFPHQWYVGSKSGCSCTFRHLQAVELGFSDPVDWYDEEQDELDATLELNATLADLLSTGYHVDLVNCWQGAQPDDISNLEVSLDEVSNTAFRMFENYKFRLNREKALQGK